MLGLLQGNTLNEVPLTDGNLRWLQCVAVRQILHGLSTSLPRSVLLATFKPKSIIPAGIANITS